ncbi:condensation domain-containing protein, partial [Mycolicibacterium hassiacum]
ARPPLFRAALARTGSDRYHLILTNHHIILDGWSVPTLVTEIFNAYQGRHLPPATPYRRFVCWLAERDHHSAYTAWRTALADLDNPTLIAPGRSIASMRRDVVWSTLPEPISRALDEVARHTHSTVSTVLQAAYAQVLMMLTGQHDVVFGTAVSGRPADLPGAEAMVGLFINTVPVRARATAVTTGAELVEQLQRFYTDTLDHHHLALTDIHRAGGHDQLFDTLFVYENYPIDTSSLSVDDQLAVAGFTAWERNHYPLTMQVQPGSALTVRVEHDADVFDRVTVEGLVARFERVLGQMVADVSRR